MIEGVAKVALDVDLTEGDKRAIGDALTRSVPDTYAGGFAISTWGEPMPVVGTTEWLAMIASNADRIAVKVQRAGTWETVWLADAPLDWQREAMRAWLASGTTPTWERMQRPAPQPMKFQSFSAPEQTDAEIEAAQNAHRAENDLGPLPSRANGRVLPGVGSDRAALAPELQSLLHYAEDATKTETGSIGLILAVRAWVAAGKPIEAPTIEDFALNTIAVLIRELDVAAGSQLDNIASRYQLKRAQAFLKHEAETDVDLRERIRPLIYALGHFVKPPPPPPVPVLPFAVPAPPPFVAPPVKTPLQHATEMHTIVCWVHEQSRKVGSEWFLRSAELEFLRSVRITLDNEMPLSDKQTQWLRDLFATAKAKASNISHLLPPLPRIP
jgi:hypothetical protein